MATKVKKVPVEKSDTIEKFEINGECKKIMIAIVTVGILQQSNIQAQVVGGKGNYLVKLGKLLTEEEVNFQLKRLEKDFRQVKWFATKK